MAYIMGIGGLCTFSDFLELAHIDAHYITHSFVVPWRYAQTCPLSRRSPCLLPKSQSLDPTDNRPISSSTTPYPGVFSLLFHHLPWLPSILSTSLLYYYLRPLSCLSSASPLPSELFLGTSHFSFIAAAMTATTDVCFLSLLILVTFCVMNADPNT